MHEFSFINFYLGAVRREDLIEKENLRKVEGQVDLHILQQVGQSQPINVPRLAKKIKRIKSQEAEVGHLINNQ